MSLHQNPKIVTDGLLFNFDMYNLAKSYKGGPTTNLIPNPTLNSYPTFNNGWGTYNTNQYNSNTYFSIGSISSVSSNIITTTGNHPLRTYDVVTPQTSGGGVTAGANYLVKKLSNNSFTLHPYNSSQDGSQGYITSTGNFFVYNDFANDVRVNVNSSSFPTMWWGPPHLPNSGLVKEIRSKEFRNPHTGEITDCVRLHYIREDGVKDGMSYGVDTSMTPGSPHTVSFYYRAATPAGVGQVIQYQVYNYTGGSAAGYSQNFTLSNDWQRFIFTYTPQYSTSISYWFHVAGSGPFSWDWSCMQTELGSVATPFVAGSRSTTQVIRDITNRSEVTVNGLTYNNDNTFNFNYANSPYLRIPLSTALNKTHGTMNFWINPTRYNGGNGYFVNREDDVPNAADWLWIGPYSDTFYFRLGNGTDCCSNDLSFANVSSVIPLNTWTNMCFTWESNATSAIYKNGQLYTSRTIGNVPSTSPASFGRIGLGHDNADDYFHGRMSNVSIYNRALSALEVLQNYNALKGKYL